MTLWSWIKNRKRLVGLTLLFGFATISMNLGLQSTSSYLIAKAATRPSTILLLWVPIVAVRFFGTGRGIVRYADRLAAHDLTLTWLRDLRVQVYQAIEPWHREQWSHTHTGDLVQRISADVDTLQNLLIAVGEPLVVGLLSLGMVLFIGSLLNPGLALIIVAMLILSGVALSWLSHIAAQQLSTTLVRGRAKLSTLLVDTWHGVIDIISFNQAHAVLQNMASLDTRWVQTKLRLHRQSGLFQGLITAVTWSGLWVVLVLAIRLVDLHQLHAILLPVAALLTLASFEIVTGLPAAFQSWGAINEARHRIDALSRTKELALPETPLWLSSSPTIAVHNLSVTYAQGMPSALSDVSLTLRPG